MRLFVLLLSLASIAMAAQDRAIQLAKQAKDQKAVPSIHFENDDV
jgi:hypothetical protein